MMANTPERVIGIQNNNLRQQVAMDEDDVVKQLMSMLGNKKEIKIKSADGKSIKLCLDEENLENQLNISNQRKGSHPHQEEDCKMFEKILEEAKDETEPIEHAQNHNQQVRQALPTKTINFLEPEPSPKRGAPVAVTKKVSLSCRNKKQPNPTNEAVLNFISDNTNKKNPANNSTMTGSSTLTNITENQQKASQHNREQHKGQTIQQVVHVCAGTPTGKKKSREKDVSRTIQFLKENHPEDREHFDIISERMIELQKMEQDKMKLDSQISSILSASFSNSLKFDTSMDQSLLSLSALSIGNGIKANDPLCQLFTNYLRRNSVSKKSQGEKMPSFLFLYSQPMLDSKGQQINEQIDYFEQESIIQKILKDCKIDYIREQATIDKFNYWMHQSISILHYCGHGLQDYLLFENHEGQSVNLDCHRLEKILNQNDQPLKLVFVASCHSQAAGRIFKAAGATHVICVQANYQILDEACQQFARIFYHSCINDKMPICSGFAFAKKQLVLSGKFGSHEVAKFTMIRDHTEEKCGLRLDIAQQGTFRDLTPKPFYKKNIPSRVENFIPRPRDLCQILKLLQSKNRFITIAGCSGIGKSTLVRELVRYVQFRNLFKDGVIYLDIRSFQKMRKVFEAFTLELFEGGAGKYEGAAGRQSKSFGEKVQNIVKELFEREVLIVLDNCQNIMLSQEKKDFKKLIEAIMKNCDNVAFVFTHRTYIGRQIDYCSEKLYELGRLTDAQAETLFFQRAPRNIHRKELEDFFRIEDVQDAAKHPFFQFLNGHPEAICMTASLLSERSLNQIYELLMKPNLTLSKQLPKKMEEEDEIIGNGVNPLVETAMKISLNVLKNKHKEAAEMLKALSLLPVGVDSEMMAKLFGTKWKETVRKLIHHSLVHCRDAGGPKYYSVHPSIIIHVEAEIAQEERLKLHQKISEEYLNRIYKVYKYIGTLSASSQRAQEQFLSEDENYKAIIFRELSFAGFNNKIRHLYSSLFQADCTDDEQDTPVGRITDLFNINTQAVEGIRKKRVYNQKILQPTKKQSISLLVVYYVTILFVTKSPACMDYIDFGIYLSRKKNKLVVEANLLRIKGCLAFNKNTLLDAKDCFLKSWDLYAIEGCGLGSASCEAAVGYIRLVEAEYAMAKKNLQNALKYYDSIAHPFGKHYLNRWLLSLKTKMNKTERQLISHHEEAQKLLKETKVLLKSSSFTNTFLTKHKLGIFVFRFTFDNLSLFLETSFEQDVRPKIINETALKKTQERGQPKFLEDFEEDEPFPKRNLNKFKER